MYKTFEERKLACLSQEHHLNVSSIADLLDAVVAASSEDRLLDLPQSCWTPAVFKDATRELLRKSGLSTSVFTAEQTLPDLGCDAMFKYWPQYSSLSERASTEDVSVGVVVEQERIISFGIVCCGEGGCDIEIIDVDQFSRRSSGLELKITLGEAAFGVGVGHIIVNLLVSTLAGPFFVDAANAESRYVFRSLGFKPWNAQNQCLLEFR